MEKKTETFVLFLAAFLVAVFCFTVVLLLFHAVPATNKDMVNIFLGIEGSAVTGVFGYYFGASKSTSTPTPEKPQTPAPAPDTKTT